MFAALLLTIATLAQAPEVPPTAEIDSYPAPVAKAWLDVINPDGSPGRVYGWPGVVDGKDMVTWYPEEQRLAPPDRLKPKNFGIDFGHRSKGKTPRILASDPETLKRAIGQCKPDQPNCPDKPEDDQEEEFKINPLKRVEDQITRWATIGVAAVVAIGGVLVAKKRS
jgi:hypothetical protein